MHIQFVKNLQFTRIIKAMGRLREFNFLKHNSGSEGYFHVDTVDDRSNRIVFNMYNKDDAWKIQQVPSLPSWILETENHLQKVIEEEMK